MSTKTSTPVDPIIEELHEIRRQIAARFDFDTRRISADARRRQLEEGKPVWQPKAPNETDNPSVGSGASRNAG